MLLSNVATGLEPLSQLQIEEIGTGMRTVLRINIGGDAASANRTCIEPKDRARRVIIVEQIFLLHLIKEWESRRDARRGQDLEERPLRVESGLVRVRVHSR